MESQPMYEVFKDLAIIIVVAKIFGILARKLKAPQVVGEIIGGLLIGPSVFGLVETTPFLETTAEIGVIILMFSAGLGTNLKDLLKTGPIAVLIACAGVAVPFVSGLLYYEICYGFSPIGSDEFYRGLFIGTILTATSVSITVESLRELGYLKGKVGTTILSAAIIDDIIGIIVLTIIIGLKSGESSAVTISLKTLLFFAFAIVVGFIAYKVFKFIDTKYTHTRRILIFSLAFCLAMAYVSEKLFGVADITGAYVAGIILCNIRDSEYIAHRLDINSYMLFGPVFFASIGIKTNITQINGRIVLFSIGFVLIGLLTKIIGCGLVSKAGKFKWSDSLKIGVGMMTRGEVALIVSRKGLDCGLLDPIYFTSVILLIIVSSILTPIILKILYQKFPEQKEEGDNSNGEQASKESVTESNQT